MLATRKALGQFFTPPEVAWSLMRWLRLGPDERFLDPSSGDGRFLTWHPRSVGIDIDPANAWQARQRAPAALVHTGDFFRWSAATRERFDAVGGNPPFIRYQAFSGEVRAHALAASSLMGADFSSLTSSWAPFVIVAASLLKPGGRMAFVVPAEIGHATYARPLLRALCAHFGRVQVVACREKFFPRLSEDCWTLHCTDYGRRTASISLSIQERFTQTAQPPPIDREVSLADWEAQNARLRPFLLPQDALDLYFDLSRRRGVKRLGEFASSGIGYVSGANDFFHLRPSEAKKHDIPEHLLTVAIRKAEQLSDGAVTIASVKEWLKEDRPVLLLNLSGVKELPAPVRRYLDGADGRAARESYKCRNRTPWYAVPDVRTPHAFLSVMSGVRPSLVANHANCVCTNSLHAICIRDGSDPASLTRGWSSPLAEFGAEIEGHPLGGGMLKLEPREAARIPIPLMEIPLRRTDREHLQAATAQARAWRHYV